MACRGVFFAITAEQAMALSGASSDEELMDLVEAIEEAWDEAHLAETDKSWDAMHRALTDGQLLYGNGPYPMSHVVVGPRQLYMGDDYIVSLVEPAEVADVARALAAVTPAWFEDRYLTVVPSDYAAEYGDDDMAYTWSYLEGARLLYQKAASEGRAVVFTVDQ